VKPARVELRIGRLVLHGFPPAARKPIGRAVERELARLLAEQGAPPALGRGGGGAVPGVDGGAFELLPGERPDAAGVRIARAIYGALER
jgi:hypothetical protein